MEEAMRVSELNITWEPLKEDYDMALQQLRRYRGVLCVNYAYVVGDFGSLKGGNRR